MGEPIYFGDVLPVELRDEIYALIAMVMDSAGHDADRRNASPAFNEAYWLQAAGFMFMRECGQRVYDMEPKTGNKRNEIMVRSFADQLRVAVIKEEEGDEK